MSKWDNISRLVNLFQVLYIYVKIYIHVKQDFKIRIKIYVDISRSASLINIDQLPGSYTDRQSNIIMKVRVPTSRSSPTPIALCFNPGGRQFGYAKVPCFSFSF